MRLREQIAEWWKGRLVPMKLDVSDNVTCIEGGYRVRPLLARVLIAVWRCCAKHWIALLSLLLALLTLILKR